VGRPILAAVGFSGGSLSRAELYKPGDKAALKGGWL